jgi:hypothetical protein
MTTSGSDPRSNPTPGDDQQDESGSSGSSGWQYPSTAPSPAETGGSAGSWSAATPSQPTGWERPGSESGDAESPSAQEAESQPSSASSAPEWPAYPETSGEATRPLPSQAPPDQPYSAGQPYAPPPEQAPPYQAPYQPYDQQAMPSYGSAASYPQPDSPQSYPGASPAGGGYGTNPYEVNPYQQGQYGGYVGYGPPPNHPQAVTAFVLGLIGVVVCGPVGIGGLVIGGRVRREIDAAPGQYSGRGLATAGWVLGIISVVFMVLGVIFVIIGITAGAFSN